MQWEDKAHWAEFIIVEKTKRTAVIRFFAVSDLGGVPGAPTPLPSPPTPHGPKFSQFHAVFRKFWQNHMLAPLLREILDPPLLC